MIIRVIGWIALCWLALFIVSQILAWLPVIVLLFGISIAVCCVYAYLPENFRLPSVEKWLNPDWHPQLAPSSPSGTYSGSGSSPTSSDSPESPGSSPSSSSPKQPDIDFSQIMRAGPKLPDRETLITKLKQKVIGQEAAIDTLVRATMGKLASQKSVKPLVCLLPGPTGTGKTEISKALAEALGVQLIRYDMGEYAEPFKASNLFGSAKGYVGSDEGGALAKEIRRSKKRFVVLFDEVEKAHQSLWPQMLAFFDEGRVTDTLSTVQAPKDTICLLTSNLEADKIGANPELAKDILREGRYFPPEFLGRINKIIPLLRLSKADTAKLTMLLAKRFADTYGLVLIIEQEALAELVEVTQEDEEKYGGRGIIEKIGDLLTDDFLDLQGDQVTQARLVVQGERLRAVPLSES